jgi:hypothetical protein
MNSEDEFSDEEEGLNYMLGFVELHRPIVKGQIAFLRHQFPSKLGGRPVRIALPGGSRALF